MFLLDAMTFGGHRPRSLEPKYEVTVKEKMLYHAITVQPAYENYSFEELRYASPALQRQSETMLVSKKETTDFKVTIYYSKLKGTFLSEDADFFVITPNRRTFFFPETEILNFGD